MARHLSPKCEVIFNFATSASNDSPQNFCYTCSQLYKYFLVVTDAAVKID
jgi:hypothetical protein